MINYQVNYKITDWEINMFNGKTSTNFQLGPGFTLVITRGSITNRGVALKLHLSKAHKEASPNQ